MRASGRMATELRKIVLEAQVSKHAEGSCFAKFGDTHVLCTASIDDRVPPFLRNSGRGWVTAEYGMLPRSTNSRTDREASRGRQTGRTQEIQRLIGRSLRSVVRLDAFGERQIRIDCDVVQADGGTRTASITGAYVALYKAFSHLANQGLVTTIPITDQVAAISCGLVDGEVLVDLDYEEDSTAQTDANFVMTAKGGLVEVQATGETGPFSRQQLDQLLNCATKASEELYTVQRTALDLV